jgi:hypothetical protein
MLVDNLPLAYDDQQVSGSGTTSTYNTNQASVTMAVSASTAGRRTRQTFRWFNYQPGKSQLILFTGVFGASATGITKRIGLLNDNNGLFFEQTSSGMAVVRRTFTSGSSVNNSVAQSSWNLDKMDGTGVSGITLDFTKTQIMIIDFEWLGVGRVRYGWVVDGIIYYCHEMNNANSLSLVYISTPNLPIRYEIVNDGTGGVSSLVQICSTVISEGGLTNTGLSLAITRGSTALITLNNTNIYPLIAIQLKSGYLSSSVKPTSMYINCPSTASYVWYLMVNPTVTGTALSFTDVTNSSIQAQTNTTNATTVSGGTLLASGCAQQTNDGGVNVQLTNDFFLGSNISGTPDVLVLAVQRVTGTTETFYASLNYYDQK